MKKLKSISVILSALLVIALVSACAQKAEEPSPAPEIPSGPEIPEALSADLNIGTLKGPTGVGMTYIFGREDEGLKLNLYDAPEQCLAGLLSGELDIAALPSNVAPVLYAKTQGGIKLIGVNTGCVLYILGSGDEIASLKELEGSTVYIGGQAAVPDYAFQALCEKEGADISAINVVYSASHADAASSFAADAGSYVVLPEPQVTASCLNVEGAKVVYSFGEKWNEAFGQDMPMGVIAARAEIVENRAGDINAFLKEYAASLEKIGADLQAAASDIEATTIIPKAPLAMKAVPNCALKLETNAENCRAELEPFFETLFGFNPASIGGALPGDDFWPDNSVIADFGVYPEF